MEELEDKYLDELFDLPELKRLKELKALIDEKYKKEIINFKTFESKYNEAKEYGAYYPGLDKIRDSFINAKKELYSKLEVKEYFDIEREVEKIVKDDFNEIKESIFGVIPKHSCKCN